MFIYSQPKYLAGRYLFRFEARRCNSATAKIKREIIWMKNLYATVENDFTPGVGFMMFFKAAVAKRGKELASRPEVAEVGII